MSLFFCNGIMPQIVRDLLLINEWTFAFASHVFTLYISNLIIIDNKNKVIALFTLIQIRSNSLLVF